MNRDTQTGEIDKKRPSENTANTEVQPDLSGSESLAEAEAAVASQPQEESADGSLPYAQPGPIEPEKAAGKAGFQSERRVVRHT